MKILILSANTGQGHNSCSEAIKETFEDHKDSCEIRDCLAFMSPAISKFVCRLHVGVYRKVPKAFSWGYGVSEKHSSIFGKKSPLYHFFVKGAESLCTYINEAGFDAVFACHVFASVMLTEAKKDFIRPVKTAFVATDFTKSPSVEHSSLDYYFIPDKALADDFAVNAITPDKIYPVGIPVRKRFFSSQESLDTNISLGEGKNTRHLLVMCGSMGCGPIPKLAGALSSALGSDCEISIICGTNEKLERKLRSKYEDDGRFHIYGFVDDTAAFMDSADLYLTKPGGLSTVEAAAKGLPMVFVNAVSGCEEYNCNYFVNSGGAVCAKEIPDIAALCAELLYDENALNEMSCALRAFCPENPAGQIYKIMNTPVLTEISSAGILSAEFYE